MQKFNLIGCLIFFFTISLNAQDLLTKQSPLPCLNKTFSIAGHVVQIEGQEMDLEAYRSDIETAIEGLNKNFEPICVSFELCNLDLISNFQYDSLENNEWEEMQVLYNLDRRINMYFNTSPIKREPPVCGFASLGGIGLLENGGIVIACIDEGTFTHEMGHYFGLKHTFEPGDSPTGMTEELVNGDNCETTGDMICDTPADPYVELDTTTMWVDVEMGCRFVATMQDANGEYYKPDVGNFMSYYDPSCSCGFTHGQYMRMVETCRAANPSMW